MKILKITKFDKDMIEVTLEGYEHARPCFPATISKENLETELKAWKVNQDSVDAENANTTPAKETPLTKEITDLVGKEI